MPDREPSPIPEDTDEILIRLFRPELSDRFAALKHELHEELQKVETRFDRTFLRLREWQAAAGDLLEAHRLKRQAQQSIREEFHRKVAGLLKQR